MMAFVLKSMIFVLKLMNFAFKMTIQQPSFFRPLRFDDTTAAPGRL